MAAQRSKAFAGLGRIDVHHHCFPGTVPELKSEFENNFFNLNYSPFPSTPEAHIEYMDEVGIQTAVIVSLIFGSLYACRLAFYTNISPDHRHHLSNPTGIMAILLQNS
jgi:light-regulated signal transduction histidine kinase (bacteriophytochrome)